MAASTPTIPAGPAGSAPPQSILPIKTPTKSRTSTRRWKCGVCSTKAGDLVCSSCVTQEAEKRRAAREHRLRALRVVRQTAAAAVQERRVVIEREAELQREAAQESLVKEDIRRVTQRVAEERIKVARAAFSLKHQRDLLASAEARLAQQENSAVELEEALLRGLRRHAQDAARVLEQRRWRKVVQLFVLLPVEPSLPRATDGERTGGERAVGAGRGGGAAAAVSGVSTLMDLPLPNNGDYSQVPLDVLMAALALVARLVSGVASCLGVSLPHPLSPSANMRYAAVAVDSSARERSSQYPLCPLSKLAETGVMGGSSSVINTVGAFETALDLLRSDVVHLCVEGAKVPVDRLWPAEALLLNLWELQQHANSELRSSSPLVDVPLPMPRDSRGPTVAVGRSPQGRKNKSHTGGGGTSSSGYADGRPPPPPMENGGDRRGALPPGGIGPDDDEATYEYVADGDAWEGLDDDRDRNNGGGGGAAQGLRSGLAGSMRSWGSRLAAAGSAGGLGNW